MMMQLLHFSLEVTWVHLKHEAALPRLKVPGQTLRELTAKEKTIHTDGLVAVLASLHAELDTAVLSAYGWDDLGPNAAQPDALLTRLVALNAQRAAEEAAGHIRWLRPAFQDPSLRAAQGNTLSNQELPVLYPIGLQADLALESAPTQPASSAPAHSAAQAATAAQIAQATPAPQSWPADLPGQVRAVAQVLASTPSPLTLPQLEAHFKGRGPWKNSLPRILQTLEALGKAQREADGATERWRA
jgi:hypothetical protein